MPDQNENASERPDLRRERVVFAPSTDYIYVYDRTDGSWSAWESADDGRDGIGYDTEQLPDDTGPIYDPELYPHPEKARADAAEKQLAEVRPLYHAAVKVLAAHLDCVKELTVECGEALAQLDQIRDLAGGFHAFLLGPGHRDPDQVRTRATTALDGIRAVFEDRLAEPVTGRETPACDCQPFDFCPKCCTPESQEETRNRQLAYCEASVQASADPEDGEQCRELREHGSIYCKAHGGGPAWDVEADTHRISEDHEEPAGTVDTCEEHGHPVRTCTYCITDPVQRGEIDESRPSEEPAGETKPRTTLVPSPMDCGAVHPESGERCVLWHSDGTPHETADGRVWEDRRQADSEAQR